MARKTIRFTDAQAKALDERAKKEGISVAELVRRSVDETLSRPFITDEMRERAKNAVGFAFSDVPDLSVNHDKYYADAIDDHIHNRLG
jgi:hypothetical protein